MEKSYQDLISGESLSRVESKEFPVVSIKKLAQVVGRFEGQPKPSGLSLKTSMRRV